MPAQLKTVSFDASGLKLQGVVYDTLMMEGELTHIIHFDDPKTGARRVTTRTPQQVS